MMQKLEKFLMPVANALSKNKVLSAIRDGFLITVPITIVVSKMRSQKKKMYAF